MMSPRFKMVILILISLLAFFIINKSTFAQEDPKAPLMDAYNKCKTYNKAGDKPNYCSDQGLNIICYNNQEDSVYYCCPINLQELATTTKSHYPGVNLSPFDQFHCEASGPSPTIVPTPTPIIKGECVQKTTSGFEACPNEHPFYCKTQSINMCCSSAEEAKNQKLACDAFSKMDEYKNNYCVDGDRLIKKDETFCKDGEPNQCVLNSNLNLTEPKPLTSCNQDEVCVESVDNNMLTGTCKKRSEMNKTCGNAQVTEEQIQYEQMGSQTVPIKLESANKCCCVDEPQFLNSSQTNIISSQNVGGLINDWFGSTWKKLIPADDADKLKIANACMPGSFPSNKKNKDLNQKVDVCSDDCICVPDDCSQISDTQSVEYQRCVASKTGNLCDKYLFGKEDKSGDIKCNDEYCRCNSCVVSNGYWSAIGCIKFDSFSGFISENVFPIAIGFAGLFAFLCIIYSAFMLQTSQGSPEKIKKAQENLTSCILGLMIIIFSVFILRLIGVSILRIPGFN
jgi:hypothetical protein